MWERASLEELLEDYRDFLRTGGHAEWDKNPKKHSMYAGSLPAGLHHPQILRRMRPMGIVPLATTAMRPLWCKNFIFLLRDVAGVLCYDEGLILFEISQQLN